MTFVSIVIPYWGEVSLLQAAVDSVLAQSDERWSLTVIDDCDPSPDAGLLMGGISDPRVRYIRNPVNLGITANFRKAVNVADGPWVTIMGFDDRLLPNYVSTVLAAAGEHPDADIIQPGVEIVDGDGARVMPLVDRVKGVLAPSAKQTSHIQGEDLAASLLRGNWLYWPSLAFRTETIRRYDFRDDLAVIQDLALLVDIAFDSGVLVRTPAPAFIYRRHDSSASQLALYNGVRFSDERRYYHDARDQARGAGWKRAERAARLRPMSRLHALAELPRILRKGNRKAILAALAHIAG